MTGRRLGRPFAPLWAGQRASPLGERLTRLALPLLALVGTGVSSGRVTTLAAVRQLPFPLPAGVLVARFGLLRSRAGHRSSPWG